MKRIYDKVHIIIPYYSGRNYLRETIQSVLKQTSPHWLLTVIDDHGPEDESEHIASLRDRRINYLRHKTNRGIIYNFNLATKIAKSPLHTISGPDDRLLPGYVERALKIFNQNPGVAYYQPNVWVIDENGKRYQPIGDLVKAFLRWSVTHGKAQIFVLSDKFLASIMHGDWLYSPAMVFNQKRITSQAQFRTKHDFILDFEEYSLAALRGDHFFIDDQYLFEYRRHNSSYSMKPEKIAQRFEQENLFYNQMMSLTKSDRSWRKTYRAARCRLTARLNIVLTAVRQRP